MDEEEGCLAEERSEKKIKTDIEEAIIGTAKEIRDNVEIIIKNPLSIKSMGALATIRIMLGPSIEELIEAYSTSCSGEEVIKKKRARGEKAEDIIYYRNKEEIGWATSESEIGYFLKKISKKEGNNNIYG